MQLQDFRIEGFRAFDHIEFRGMANVNLIVGKNSIGKTTVLEAIRLFLTEDYLRIADILASRDEYSFRRTRRSSSNSVEPVPLSFESMFFGRPPLNTYPSFQVGPVLGPGLKVGFTWVRRVEDEASASVRYVAGEPDAQPEADPDLLPGFHIENHVRALVPLDRLERFARRPLSRPSDKSIIYLPSSGMGSGELGRIWDSVALTEDEDLVILALRAIFPTLEKLVLVQSPSGDRNRILMAKVREFENPVPFKSLGDGVFHLLSIILAMINAKGGALLADEIENGLHFSVQSEIWAIICRQAILWDVQVFATTHSWDCVRGLQMASTRPELKSDYTTRLFRIERNLSAFKVTNFSAEEVSIAEQRDIEIR